MSLKKVYLLNIDRIYRSFKLKEKKEGKKKNVKI